MKLDLQLIGYINLFENITKARIKDCFFGKNNVLIFIVQPGELGKAIGKDVYNIKKLAIKLKYKIRVLGFNNDPNVFVKNILYPLNGFEVNLRNDKVAIITEDKVLKGKIYGRDRSNLKQVNEIFKKYFKNLDVVIE